MKKVGDLWKGYQYGYYKEVTLREVRKHLKLILPYSKNIED